MAKFTIFLLVIFLAVLSLLSFFNKETVNITVWNGVVFENIPVIAVIFISAAAGIISMFLIAVLRDARRHIDNWHIQRKRKKEAKVLDSFSKGIEAFFAERYNEAAELFAGVLEHDPTSFITLLRLGDIALSNKDYYKSEEYYLKAKELKPKSIEAMLSLARLAETQKRWKDAIEHLDNILEIDGDNIMVLSRKRSIYESNKEWEKLLDVQQKILKCKLTPEKEKEENGRFLGYRYELGRHYIETGSSDKAIKSLKSVIKSDSHFIAAYIALAEAYLRSGDSKEAQDVLMEGYEETSSLVLLVRLEDHFIDEGEPGTIIDIYQKAIQKDQRDQRLQFFLAKLYYRLEMIDYAMDTVDSIDVSSFDYPDLHKLLGSIYERRSEYGKATHEFKKALSVERPMLIPYCCSACNHISSDWSGRCPQCGNWNTFILDVNEICKIRKRQGST